MRGDNAHDAFVTALARLLVFGVKTRVMVVVHGCGLSVRLVVHVEAAENKRRNYPNRDG